MKRHNHLKLGSVVFAGFLFLPLLTVRSAELSFTTLASFSGTNGSARGGIPESKLLLANDGYMYGATIYGGTNSLGTVFKVNAAGDFSTLMDLSLSTGYAPQAGLSQGNDGILYGTTTEGGAYFGGTAFRLSADGQFTVFASFEVMTGVVPNGVVQAHDGNLYGTAQRGGTNGYGLYGTIFKLSTNGNLSTLHHFGSRTNASGIGLDGEIPQAMLVESSDGVLYGTTTGGGTNGGFGTIFRVTTNGVFSSLCSFNGTNGANPIGQLVEAFDGSFYGTATAGGIGFNGQPYSGNGTAFRITKSGDLTVVHYFEGYPDDGAVPEFVGLAAGTDGKFYGTTFYGGALGSGTAFRMTAGGAIEILYSFSRSDFQTGTNLDGNLPSAGLTQAKNGNFYGVAQSGGAYGLGTVFCLSNSVFSQPLIQAIIHTNTTTILGWMPLAGRLYQLQSKRRLGIDGWTNVGGAVPGNSRTAASVDAAATDPNRVYRLVLLP